MLTKRKSLTRIHNSKLYDIIIIIDSVKGSGQVIATEVLITTSEFNAAGDPDIDDPKKNACYGGFAPSEHSCGSPPVGKHKGKAKVSNKANKKSQSSISQCCYVSYPALQRN